MASNFLHHVVCVRSPPMVADLRGSSAGATPPIPIVVTYTMDLIIACIISYIFESLHRIDIFTLHMSAHHTTPVSSRSSSLEAPHCHETSDALHVGELPGQFLVGAKFWEFSKTT